VGKQNHIPNRTLIRQQHNQPVNADAFAGRGRHAVGQRPNKIFIERHGFVISPGARRQLLLKAPPLFVRIVELGKGIGAFHAADEQLETIHKVRVVISMAGQGTQLGRKARDEGRLDKVRLGDVFKEFAQPFAIASRRGHGQMETFHGARYAIKVG
jgi:hypothetical protein